MEELEKIKEKIDRVKVELENTSDIEENKQIVALSFYLENCLQTKGIYLRSSVLDGIAKYILEEVEKEANVPIEERRVMDGDTHSATSQLNSIYW
jgi:hypothetical protein